MKKIFGALLLSMAVAAAAPAIASADYPNTPPVVGSSSSTPAPGAPITLSVQSFCPGAVVTFRIGTNVVGTATANASGVASIVTTAPAAAGTFTVQATSTTPCNLTATTSISVQAPAPATTVPGPPPTVPGGLPRTGSEPMNWVRTGGIALLVGLGMVGAARLRRRPQVTAS